MKVSPLESVVDHDSTKSVTIDESIVVVKSVVSFHLPLSVELSVHPVTVVV